MKWLFMWSNLSAYKEVVQPLSFFESAVGEGHAAVSFAFAGVPSPVINSSIRPSKYESALPGQSALTLLEVVSETALVDSSVGPFVDAIAIHL